MRKHDWPRYVNGDPRPNRGGCFECRRCGVMYCGFTFEEIDSWECPQPELEGWKELDDGKTAQ